MSFCLPSDDCFAGAVDVLHDGKTLVLSAAKNLMSGPWLVAATHLLADPGLRPANEDKFYFLDGSLCGLQWHRWPQHDARSPLLTYANSCTVRRFSEVVQLAGSVRRSSDRTATRGLR